MPDAKPPFDWGRVVALVVFSLLVALNATLLLMPTEVGSSLPVKTTRILTLAFYVLLVGAYWRRSASSATDRNPAAWLAAFAATCCPFLIPLVGGTRSTDGVQGTIAAVILIIGSSFMLWALAKLGRNISLVPQARDVVTSGPYAWVRHPLYAAEIVNTTGVCLAFHGAWPWVLLAAFVGIQYFRARREEALLASVLTGYDEYRSRTPMLLPRPPRAVRSTRT